MTCPPVPIMTGYDTKLLFDHMDRHPRVDVMADLADMPAPLAAQIILEAALRLPPEMQREIAGHLRASAGSAPVLKLVQ